MRVSVHPDDSACGWTRLRWVAQALQAQGAEVVIRSHLNAVWERSQLGNRVVGAAPLDADVVVVQRIFDPAVVIVLRDLKRQGVRLVVDNDDDFMALGPAHPAWARIHPRTGTRSRDAFREVLQLADLVTVSTPALAKKYNGVVIRNCIPKAYLGVERTEQHQAPVIGWPGTPITHPGDLEVVGDAISRLCPPAAFRAIGDPATLDVLGVPNEQHQAAVSLSDFAYARAVAQLDIGIAPLALSAFAEAKSWLKPLEYSALGVPFVASPTSEYLEFNRMGAGWIASRPRQWHGMLGALAASSEQRAELAAKGRAVAARWTIEGTMSSQVWDAWSSGVRATAVRS